MTGEIVGSASVRIEPDTSGFSSALLSDIQPILDQVSQQIVSSFKDASEQATQALATIGSDGLDAISTAGTAAAGDLTSAFDTASSDITAGLTSAADEGGAALVGAADEATQALASIGDVNIAVTADTSEAGAAIADVVTAGDGESIDIPVTVDTSDAETQISSLGDTASGTTLDIAGLAGGLEKATGASESAAGVAGALGGALSSISPATAGAVAGVSALGAITKSFVGDALKADSATRFLTQTTGEFKGAVESVNVGTLNGNLQDLAKQTGNNIPLLETAAGKLFQLGVSSGEAGPKVADTTDQVIALALNAVNLRPALGEAGDVVDSLGRGLARGGRFLSQYGISLTAAQINQEAFNETGKQSATQLTQFEKEAAGAKLASDQLGASFKSNLDTALDNPAVKLKVLANNFEILKEQTGAGILLPVVDILEKVEPLLEDVTKLVGGVVTAFVPLVTVAADVVGPLAKSIDTAGAAGTALLGLGTAAGVATLALTTLELTPLGILAGLAASAAIAVSSVIHAFSDDSSQKAFKADVESLTAALTDQAGVLHITAQGVQDYITAASGFDKGNFSTAVKQAGLDIANVAKQSTEGKVGAAAFNAEVTKLGSQFVVVGKNIVDLKSQFALLQKEQDAVAVAAIKVAQGNNDITEAQAKAALGAKDHTAALKALQPTIDANVASSEELTAAYQPLLDAANRGAAGLKAVNDESAGAGAALAGLANDGINPTSNQLVTFATGMNNANLSTKGLDNAAIALGITTAQLTGFLTGVSGAIASFTSKVVSGLPSVADAFKPVTSSAGSAGGAMVNAASQALQAQRSIESAQHGIEIANRGVVDSADGLVKANQGVQTSVEGLTKAQQNLQDAERSLADARQAASPKDVEQANINLARAQLDATKATDSVTKAEDTLNNARAGVGTTSVHDAEIALQDARLSAEESTIRISDAEDALTKVRQIGTEADSNVVSAEKAVATARDGVATATAATITAQHQVELAHRAVADAAYAATQAEEALQQALAKPASGGGGGGGAVKETTVSLAEFVTNLQASTTKTQRFFSDIQTIFHSGNTELAGEIAQFGIGAITVADQAAQGIQTGNTALVNSAQQAVIAQNKTLNDMTLFVQQQFGPAYIATTGLVANLASTAFGNNLSFAAKMKIQLAETSGTLDVQGAAIALLAGEKGNEAAVLYAKNNNIDERTLEAGLEAAKILRENKELPAGAAALATAASGDFHDVLTKGLSSGVTSAANSATSPPNINEPERLFKELGKNLTGSILAGMVDKAAVQSLNDAAAGVARGAWGAAAGPKGADTGSPSKLFMKLGRDMTAGMVVGLTEDTESVTAVATAIVQAAAGAVGGTINAGLSPLVNGFHDGFTPADVEANTKEAIFRAQQAFKVFDLGAVTPAVVSSSSPAASTTTVPPVSINFHITGNNFSGDPVVAGTQFGQAAARVLAKSELITAIRATGK